MSDSFQQKPQLLGPEELQSIIVDVIAGNLTPSEAGTVFNTRRATSAFTLRQFGVEGRFCAGSVSFGLGSGVGYSALALLETEQGLRETLLTLNPEGNQPYFRISETA